MQKGHTLVTFQFALQILIMVWPTRNSLWTRKASACLQVSNFMNASFLNDFEGRQYQLKPIQID